MSTIISGSFDRTSSGVYESNILINNQTTYVIPDMCTNAIFNIYINLSRYNINQVIDVDFIVSGTKIRKSITNPTTATINMSFNTTVTIGTSITIIGYISNIWNITHTIDNTRSTITYDFNSTYTQNKVTNNLNIYNEINNDIDLTIINTIYNLTTSNSKLLSGNNMYIMSEDNIITFPAVYNDYVYKKFVMVNDIIYQDLEYLKKNINITNINSCSKTQLDKFINNALSYFLDFGFFVKDFVIC